jgi:hypothetical protein
VQKSNYSENFLLLSSYFFLLGQDFAPIKFEIADDLSYWSEDTWKGISKG